MKRPSAGRLLPAALAIATLTGRLVMRTLPKTLSATITAAGLAVAAGLVAIAPPAAHAAAALPHFTDGSGLTVVAQPAWVDERERTFSFTVTTDEVPAYTVLPGQVSGEHVVVVTLPEDYDGTTRYPVHYTLHGGGGNPASLFQQSIVEQATAGVPLITVSPNGGGRGWYTNWEHPGTLGAQNWETFHLEQLIPFIDANLRTIPAKEGRAISGHSMGGFGAMRYAQVRPDLFAYVGTFSGGLDLLNQEQRATVIATALSPTVGWPTVAPDAIFGSPIWPLDRVWNERSPAQHVASLRGMGVAMYVGNGGNLLDNPVQAVAEQRIRETNLVAAAHLTRAGIPFAFLDYGDGSGWAEGCTGKHGDPACLRADMVHFVSLIMERLQHP